MIINNGKPLTLVVPGIPFAGPCGVHRGEVAFTPLAPIAYPLAAYPAELDGKPVVITGLQLDANGRSYTAQVLG